jgi:sugar-specific transcriptional regulator TrmB
MSIVPFGFTRTQDTVFWALFRRGNATGYALARDTGIARANVYHALGVLANRGLASSTGGRPSRYQVAGSEACLALLGGEVRRDLLDLATRLGIAGDALPPALQATTEAGAVQSASDVVREASQCLNTASSEILAVVGPWAAELLPELTAARRRGVTVRVVSLGLPAPEGAILRNVRRVELESYWGGLPVLLVVDRRRAVCGILVSDGARGIVTSNPGIVPFLRHLLRRELASAAAPRVS